MKKYFTMLVMAGFLATSTAVPDVSAKNKDRAEAIAGIIALGLLGAAAAQHQHDQGHEHYRPHPRFHPDENAVGTCMHHAKRTVKRAGGFRIKLNNVSKVASKPNGRTVVLFEATGYYDFGHKRSRIRCVVKNHRIVKFKIL